MNRIACSATSWLTVYRPPGSWSWALDGTRSQHLSPHDEGCLCVVPPGGKAGRSRWARTAGKRGADAQYLRGPQGPTSRRPSFPIISRCGGAHRRSAKRHRTVWEPAGLVDGWHESDCWP